MVCVMVCMCVDCAVQFRGKRRPRKRMRKFILELAGDQEQQFGQKVSQFITQMRAHTDGPYHEMLKEVDWGYLGWI